MATTRHLYSPNGRTEIAMPLVHRTRPDGWPPFVQRSQVPLSTGRHQVDFGLRLEECEAFVNKSPIVLSIDKRAPHSLAGPMRGSYALLDGGLQFRRILLAAKSQGKRWVA